MRILRYIIWFIIVLLIVLLLGRLFFGGGGGDKSKNKVTSQSTYIDAAGSNSSVRFVMAGTVNGKEIHKQVRITVSSSTRTLDILEGYSGQAVSTQSYPNDIEAYREFLSALYTSGFTKENPDNVNPDISGRCPLGTKYIYTSSEIANVPDELWTTSCKSVIGTFGGDSTSINKLFRLQIPNYDKQTSSVNLAQS
jgi:hypothetical protein